MLRTRGASLIFKLALGDSQQMLRLQGMSKAMKKNQTKPCFVQEERVCYLQDPIGRCRHALVSQQGKNSKTKKNI
jgi:hypothetical protein